MGIFRYLTNDKIRPKIVSSLNYVPNWIKVPLPVGHGCMMWLRPTPAELRYVLPDKEGGVEKALLERLSPGETMFDVGAHLGYYSLIVSQSVNNIDVRAFEPHPGHAERIRWSTRWNRSCLSVEELAVSNVSEQTELSVANRGGGHSLGNGKKSINIQTTTIDEYRNTKGVNPNIIKLDIEGAEVRAVKGMMNTLRECEPDVLCEVHPSRICDFGDSLDEMYTLLSDVGYRILALPSEDRLSKSEFVEKANVGSVNKYGMETHLHIVAES